MGRTVGAISEGARARRLLPLPLALGRRLLGLRRVRADPADHAVHAHALRLARAAAADRGAPSPTSIVSVYPQATEVLGRLRRAGRLHVPVCAVITDLAALRYWATPGADLHLVTHPESIDEVRSDRRRRRRRSTACTASPRRSSSSRVRALEARRALGLDPAAKIVLVSGGGWGVGDVEGAVREVLAVEGRRPGRLPLRPQRGAPRSSSNATSPATRACASSRSPTRCPTGSPRPTRSSTRPAA